MRPSELNALSLIGIAGGLLMLVGAQIDFGNLYMSAVCGTEIWLMRATGALTMVFCGLRLFRRYYGISRRRLLPVAVLYAATLALMIASLEYVDIGDFSIISIAAMPIGAIGCVLCAYMMIPKTSDA